MYYISIRQGKEISFDHIGPMVFRLPPTFSLLWTLGSNIDSGCLYFFFSFPSFQRASRKNTAGNDGVFLHKILRIDIYFYSNVCWLFYFINPISHDWLQICVFFARHQKSYSIPISYLINLCRDWSHYLSTV